MRKLLYFVIFLVFLSVGHGPTLASSDNEVIVCPGKGEKCSVSKNGISNPFNKQKGKTDAAIEMPF